jgi:DDE superfamily endonuclease
VPGPAAGRAGQLQFPVHESEAAFQRNLYRLKPLAAHHRTILGTMQPYRHDDPDTSALGWLNRLARIDRHRRLTVTTAYVAELRPIVGVPVGCTVELEWGERVMIDDVAEVARFTVTPWREGCKVGANLQAGIDPEIAERAADVCGLYLVPPTNALVLSVDEKTGIGARSRTRPATRPAPGRPSRQEHEYVRHGTATLLAALDVHRGGVVQAADVDRNTAANFTCFLDELDACVPADLQVHLVLDNGASHIANATRWWFVDHSRFHAHSTPTHALWLNQVELFFSILARRLRKRGEFASVEDLVAKVMAFIADYNRTAKPFR